LSFSLAMINWINKWFPKFSILNFKFLIISAMYLLVLIPLKLNHTIGIARNTLWGIDKILLGTIVGSIAFLIGIWADKKVRALRGKQLFIYQKVVFPVAALILASVVGFILTT